MRLQILIVVLGLGWTQGNNVFLSMGYDFALHSNISVGWACTQVDP